MCVSGTTLILAAQLGSKTWEKIVLCIQGITFRCPLILITSNVIYLQIVDCASQHICEGGFCAELKSMRDLRFLSMKIIEVVFF